MWGGRVECVNELRVGRRERSCLLTIPCLSLFSSTSLAKRGSLSQWDNKRRRTTRRWQRPPAQLPKKCRGRFKMKMQFRRRRDFDATNIPSKLISTCKRVCIGIVIRIMFHGKRMLLEPFSRIGFPGIMIFE